MARRIAVVSAVLLWIVTIVSAGLPRPLLAGATGTATAVAVQSAGQPATSTGTASTTLTTGPTTDRGPNLDDMVTAQGSGAVSTPPVSSTGGGEIFVAFVSAVSTAPGDAPTPPAVAVRGGA